MKYYIYCAHYLPQSYGIRILYTLAEQISRAGKAVACVCYEKKRKDVVIPPGLRKLISYVEKDGMPELNDEDIAIYCDVTSDNPFHAKRVVRYLLNKPTVLTGVPIEYGEADYLLAYSGLISDWLPRLYLLNDDRKELQRYRNIPREDLVTYYFGKVDKRRLRENLGKVKRVKRDFEQARIITRHYPKTKDELFSLVARSSLMVSFDPITNLNYEASLLGTPVLLVDDTYNTRGSEYECGAIYDYRDYAAQRLRSDGPFLEYSRKIEAQGESVSAFLVEVERHFRDVESGRDDYRERASRIIQRQRECDDVALETHPFVTSLQNYDKPEALPLSVKVHIQRGKIPAIIYCLILLGPYSYGKFRRIVNGTKKRLRRAPFLYRVLLRTYYLINFAKWPKAFKKIDAGGING